VGVLGCIHTIVSCFLKSGGTIKQRNGRQKGKEGRKNKKDLWEEYEVKK